MQSPLEIIGRARRRIARIAALRALIEAAGPAIVALAAALALEPIGRFTWARFGYAMAPGRGSALRIGLLIGGAIAALAGIAAAFIAWRKADDFAGAASELDRRVHGREQIVTLASIAGPATPVENAARRTPLFPILWRHSAEALSNVDIEREFRLDPAQPLKRSALMAAMALLAMAAVTMGLVRMPTPEQALAAKLRAIAEEIAKPGASPRDVALANSVQSAADALEDPKLPPEQRRQLIEKVRRLAAPPPEKHYFEASSRGSGKGHSAYGGKDSDWVGGKGNESGGKNKSDAGTGGTGKGAAGRGTNGNEPGSGKNGQANNNDRIDLQNDLAKADAQIEADNSKNNGPSPANAPGGNNNQPGPKPGANPNQPGAGSGPNPNAPGQMPEQSKNGNRNIPNAGGNSNSTRDRGANRGNTHLGEFPAPANFQRFLKPGEKGAALGIHDARYVTFRIPAAIPSGPGAGGETVLDASRPRASAPYVNAPLPPMRSDAPPDEQQPIPPRYRGMIQ